MWFQWLSKSQSARIRENKNNNNINHTTINAEPKKSEANKMMRRANATVRTAQHSS